MAIVLAFEVLYIILSCSLESQRGIRERALLCELTNLPDLSWVMHQLWDFDSFKSPSWTSVSLPIKYTQANNILFIY